MNNKVIYPTLFLLSILSWTTGTTAQTTYYKNVQPILAAHCMPCHQSKNIGPMPLDNYYSVKAFANMIVDVTASKVMPPYQIDAANCNENIVHNNLSPIEVYEIKKWIAQGMSAGENTPIPFTAKDTLLSKSITFAMQSAYEVKASKEEHTQIYVIPNLCSEDIYTNKIEFFAGRKEFIKSAFVFIDTTDECIRFDKMDLNYGYNNYSSVAFKPAEYAWYGWNPYEPTLTLPDGYLKEIPRHSNILIQVTYKAYYKNYRDSTSYLKVWLRDKSASDKIIQSNFIIDSTYLINKPFMIYKNESKTVKAVRIVEKDMEIHGITPFGQNVLTAWSVYITDANNKSQPILNIPQWDMHWKKVYNFHQAIKVKKGSKIIAEATYDFTEENIRLPIIPLGRVPYGEGPKNELFLVAMDVSIDNDSN